MMSPDNIAMLEAMELTNAKRLLARNGYHVYDRPRPVVTATVALFYHTGSALLTFLGLRNPKSSAYPDHWCIPGGKLDAKSDDFAGETLKEAAIREVEEETGIRLRPDQLRFLLESSHPQTDPRGHFVNIVFIATVDAQQFEQTSPGSDLVDGGWFDYAKSSSKRLAFDHTRLLGVAQSSMRGWE